MVLTILTTQVNNLGTIMDGDDGAVDGSVVFTVTCNAAGTAWENTGAPITQLECATAAVADRKFFLKLALVVKHVKTFHFLYLWNCIYYYKCTSLYRCIRTVHETSVKYYSCKIL